MVKCRRSVNRKTAVALSTDDEISDVIFYSSNNAHHSLSNEIVTPFAILYIWLIILMWYLQFADNFSTGRCILFIKTNVRCTKSQEIWIKFKLLLLLLSSVSDVEPWCHFKLTTIRLSYFRFLTLIRLVNRPKYNSEMLGSRNALCKLVG